MQLPNPQTKKLVQLNNSNVMGDLWATFNIDLSENEGVVRVGKRLILNTNTADIATLTSYPVGFAAFAGKKWTLAGTGTGPAFSTSSPYPSDGTFTQVLGSGVPSESDSTVSDLIVSNDMLYMTGKSNTVHYTSDGSTWGSFTAGSSSVDTHMLASYAHRTYMTTLVSTIISWDSANTVASSGSNTLTLSNSASNVITFIKPASNRIWIGTVNTLGGNGYVYEWDGSSQDPTKSYRMEAQGALACVIKDDVPYIMDSNGTLLVWNGGTFKRLTQLNRRRNRLLWNANSSVNNRFIHPNGMTLVNGKVVMLIDGRNYDGSATASTIEATISSGIYEYDENHGLVHKYSFGTSKSGGTITDYGQVRVAGVGGMSDLNIASANSGRNGTFMAGATYYTTATVSTSGAFYDDSNDTLQKAGYLITTKIRPDASKLGPVISSTFRKFYLAYRQLLSSSDRIVVKFRYLEAEPTSIDITWASTTSFTTSDGSITNYVAGDEVEVIQGNGGGVCAHITAISGSGPYTVTIDETVASSAATAKVRLQKWSKLVEINDQTSTWAQMGVSMLAVTWVQFKIWMLFTGQDEVENLYPVDAPSQIAQ